MCGGYFLCAEEMLAKSRANLAVEVAIGRRWTRGASDVKRLLAEESGKCDVGSDVLLAELTIVLWIIVDWQKPKC